MTIYVHNIEKYEVKVLFRSKKTVVFKEMVTDDEMTMAASDFDGLFSLPPSFRYLPVFKPLSKADKERGYTLYSYQLQDRPDKLYASIKSDRREGNLLGFVKIEIDLNKLVPVDKSITGKKRASSAVAKERYMQIDQNQKRSF